MCSLSQRDAARCAAGDRASGAHRNDLGAIATWTRAEKSASTFATWTGGTGHAAGWTSDPPHLN